MSRALQGKVAIITGSASGIGKEIAFEYAAQGAKVVKDDVLFSRGWSWPTENDARAVLETSKFMAGNKVIDKPLQWSQVKDAFSRSAPLIRQALTDTGVALLDAESMERAVALAKGRTRYLCTRNAAEAQGEGSQGGMFEDDAPLFDRPLAPELVAAVKSGTISLNTAAAVATLPAEEQVAAAHAGKDELKLAAKRVREAKRKPREEATPETATPVDAGSQWRLNSPSTLRHSLGPISCLWLKRTECRSPSRLVLQKSRNFVICGKSGARS